MLTVILKDGNIREYKPEDYTDYEWRKEAFIVLRDNQWISIYNWDQVKEVHFHDYESLLKEES